MSSSEEIRKAFDPELFRQQGHQLVEQLAEHLSKTQQGFPEKVTSFTEPSNMLQRWPREALDQKTQATFQDSIERLLQNSIQLHHPHYIGHQVTPPLPMAALCDLAVSLLNNGMAVYEMGATGFAMEQSLLRWMAKQLGLPQDADGVFTSGGSIGNLTALLAARQAKTGFDIWTEGNQKPLCVLVSSQAHYSILRAVQIMGWGKQGAQLVPVDEKFRLDANALTESKQKAEKEGFQVIGVVANACSTATGAFDPLEKIAKFCQEHNLWFHVDAAHGASVILSEKYRHHLQGISLADSVIWDAHKLLLVPSLCTGLLFRNPAHTYQAFAQKASYLFSKDNPAEEWFNLGQRTLECTKPMMSVKLYLTLMHYGTAFFGDYVTSICDLAKTFAAFIKESSDFELPVEPTCNIVCFRYKPKKHENTLDELQDNIRQKLLKSGKFYLVQTHLPTGLYLRITLLNPLVNKEILRELLDEIRKIANE